MKIREALALTWGDIDWQRSLIYVRRAWVRGRMQRPKSKASKAPVPMHEALAMILREWRSQSSYARDSDLIFASAAKKGTKPRTATMLVQDYVRPCAVKAGVLTINDGETLDYNGNRVE